MWAETRLLLYTNGLCLFLRTTLLDRTPWLLKLNLGSLVILERKAFRCYQKIQHTIDQPPLHHQRLCCYYLTACKLRGSQTKLPLLQYLQQSQYKATEISGCLLGHGNCNALTLSHGLSGANLKVLWDLLDWRMLLEGQPLIRNSPSFTSQQFPARHLPVSQRKGGRKIPQGAYFKKTEHGSSKNRRLKAAWCPLSNTFFLVPGDAATTDTNPHDPAGCKPSATICGNTSDERAAADGCHPHPSAPAAHQPVSRAGNCPTAPEPGRALVHFPHSSHHSRQPSREESPPTCGCLGAGCSAPTPAVALITLNTWNSAAAAQAASKRTLLLIKNLLLKSIKLCNANNPLEIICSSS